MDFIIYWQRHGLYFNSFGIEYILQEVWSKIKDKSITHNIFRIPDDDSIICGFCCFVFMEYMLKGKTLLDYANLFSFFSGCVSISAFASLVVVPLGIANSAVEWNIYAITAGIKKFKCIMKKKRKKHDNIVLLGKVKLDAIEFLLSKALIDSFISHNEFVSVSNVLREYNETTKQIKNAQNVVEYAMQKRWKCIVSLVRKILWTKF